MNNKSPAQFDIAIMGMGVRDVAHITIEFINILKQCKLGFVVSQNQESVDKFRTSLSSFVSEGNLLPPLFSLTKAYDKERYRYKNYCEAASIVLDSANSDRPVAYLTPGNPVTFDRVAQEIINGSNELKLKLKVIPGISFLDTILVDIQQELAPGMQIYEASWFVGMEVSPDTRLSCMLVQTSIFGTSYAVIDRKPQKSTLIELKEYLLKFYPKDHLVALVRSGIDEDSPANVCPVKIGDLDNVSSSDQIGASMFIPPLDEAKLTEEFADMMFSKSNLNLKYPEI